MKRSKFNLKPILTQQGQIGSSTLTGKLRGKQVRQRLTMLEEATLAMRVLQDLLPAEQNALDGVCLIPREYCMRRTEGPVVMKRHRFIVRANLNQQGKIYSYTISGTLRGLRIHRAFATLDAAINEIERLYYEAKAAKPRRVFAATLTQEELARAEQATKAMRNGGVS